MLYMSNWDLYVVLNYETNLQDIFNKIVVVMITLYKNCLLRTLDSEIAQEHLKILDTLGFDTLM
jgi:hypothetical protein